MNYKILINRCNNSKICFDNSVHKDTIRGGGTKKYNNMKALQFSIILVATILLDSCGCGICAFERTDWPLAITFVKSQDTVYSFFNPDYLGQGIHFPKVFRLGSCPHESK
jgi:hypothetical protein